MQDFQTLQKQCMHTYQNYVLPYAGDPRENFKATAVLNFHGILDSIEYFLQNQPQADLQAIMLRNEFLSMPIARQSKDWAYSVLVKSD